MYNLRPFYPYTVIPATSVGLIYLIIVSFFSFSFYLPIHLKYLKPEGHPPLKFYQLIIWRWTATVVAYLFLSLSYSLLSLAFQINFEGGNSVQSQTMVTVAAEGNPDAFGKGTFVRLFPHSKMSLCKNKSLTALPARLLDVELRGHDGPRSSL